MSTNVHLYIIYIYTYIYIYWLYASVFFSQPDFFEKKRSSKPQPLKVGAFDSKTGPKRMFDVDVVDVFLGEGVGVKNGMDTLKTEVLRFFCW